MNEQSIFLAALEIADPKERENYLDRACADDPSLRKQVEALLAEHERSGEFLDVPVLKQMVGSSGDPNIGAETSINASASDGEIELSFLEPSTVPGSLGRLLHYEVRELIGRGGCGIVLKAFDTKLERIVAIKVMAPELAATSPARKRFLREARATAAIRHENVVSIYAVEEQPLPFLVMEYIEGETLQQRIDRTGPLDVREVLRIGQQIVAGLAAAHDRGLIHRDIKPGNILLEDGTDHLKITDFGLARSADDASMTQSGVIAGTPLYMSPEQAQAHNIDHRSDLFSLGSVLYVMCSGRPPFRAPSTLAVLKRVVEEQPRPIEGIIPEVPKWLRAIIAKLHEKEPEERIASARRVGKLLAHCQSELEQYGRVKKLPKDILAKLPQVETERQEQDAGESVVHQANPTPPPEPRNWPVVAAVALVLLIGLGMTEATGVTNVLRGTVIRLFSPEGTLVVEVDDPGVSVTIDGEEMVITGTGAKEIRLKPGQYKLLATKDGEVVRQELVTVTSNGRQVVRVSRESAPAAAKARASAVVDRKPTFINGGDWRIDGTELVQAKPGNAMLLFGDEKWTDYDLSVETLTVPIPVKPGAKKNQGGNHYFRATSQNDYLNFSLGAYFGTANEVCYKKGGKWGRDGTFLNTVHVEDHWYKVRVEIRGAQVRCHLDGKLIFAFKDDRFPAGGIGLATWNSVVRWRNLKVTAPDGKVLWEGFPELPTSATDRHATEPSALSAANDLAEKVRQELRKLNPDFKGVIALDIEEGRIVGCKIAGGEVSDLSPLSALTELRQLDYEALDPKRDAPVVREMASLETINGYSAATFRLAYPANKPAGGVDVAWLEAVADLPLKARTAAVVEKLQELNPNFDGKYIAHGSPEDWYLTFDPRAVTDLSPLKALPELRQLVCYVRFPNRTWLSDLSPLSGIPLTRLECDRARIADLSPLKDMPLATLHIASTPVEDLSPLEGMPLRNLDLFQCRLVTDLSPLAGAPLKRLVLQDVPISDLAPLKDAPLEWLNIGWTRVTDISVLKGKPLHHLELSHTEVTDLSPVADAPLTELYVGWGSAIADLAPIAGAKKLRRLDINGTKIDDLSPLQGMHLTFLDCNATPVSDLSPLRGMPLETLQCNRTPVADLTPLKESPLKTLYCEKNILTAANLKVLRSLDALQKINNRPAADVLREPDTKSQGE